MKRDDENFGLNRSWTLAGFIGTSTEAVVYFWSFLACMALACVAVVFEYIATAAVLTVAGVVLWALWVRVADRA